MQSSYNVIKSNFAKNSEKKLISTEYTVKNFIPEENDEENEIISEKPQIDLEEILKKYEYIGKKIIEDAQREKEAIILRTQLTSNKLEKEAYDRGYNQGIQNGYDDGYKKAYEETIGKAKLEAEEIIEKTKLEAEEIINNAETLLKSARDNYCEYLENKKTEIIKLALEIASNITRQKLAKEDSMNILVEDAFKLSKGEESIILKANSFHCEELKSNISKWKVEYSVKNEIFVISDDSLEKGNAILEKPSGIVKVGIDIGMEQIKKALLG